MPVPEQQKALQRIRTLRVEGLSPRKINADLAALRTIAEPHSLLRPGRSGRVVRRLKAQAARVTLAGRGEVL